MHEVDYHRAPDRHSADKAPELNVQQVNQFPDQRRISGMRADGPGPNDVSGGSIGKTVDDDPRFTEVASRFMAIAASEVMEGVEYPRNAIGNAVIDETRRAMNGQIADDAFRVASLVPDNGHFNTPSTKIWATNPLHEFNLTHETLQEKKSNVRQDKRRIVKIT